MPLRPAPSAALPAAFDRRSARGLDWLNFFVANLQTAFGPFIAVYLTGQHWTQGQIGVVLTVGTVTAMASQVPAGWLVDRLRDKHRAASAAIIAIVASCLMLAVLPERLPVALAEVLHGFASCMLNPAIAAITLSVVASAALARPANRDGVRHPDTADAAEAAHLALGERFGRNASFGSIGNAVAAGLMGATGWLVSARATFFLGAALALPGLLALRAIARPSHPPARVADEHETRSAPSPGHGLRDLLRDRRLYGFAVCVVLFHLANAGMLPLAAGQVTRQAADLAEVVIAGCILLPQLIGAALSPRIGRWAGVFGRKPVMLVCFGFLPLRGLLLALSSSPVAVVASQLLDSVSSAAFGVMLPLVAADLSRGTGRFNLCLGVLGLFMGIGASFSTTLSGLVADRSVSAGFLLLSAAGLLCLVAVWLLFTETAPVAPPRPRSFPSRRRSERD
ncbi:MAG: MFS transporter [Gluconacetobacter diazotrophicus]|nr:MFS transporter [Gluconacetobacter diazotrophicus]